MNKIKRKGESKPAIPRRPSIDLAEEADAARGKREGQEQVSTPSHLLPTSSEKAQRQLWFIPDCSITSSPNKKMLDHTASPEQSCALYSPIWGFAPAQTSVLTSTSFSSLNTDSLWHIHMAPTLGTGVPKLWYQHHPLYVGHSKAAPEYHPNSWSPPTTHPFHKTQVAHSKAGVAQETSLGEKRSRPFSYTHCIQQISPPCSVPLLKIPPSIQASQANSPPKERLLKH